MKILLSSHHFFPSTGGIETVSNLLAREFVELGHEVRVVTQTSGDGGFPFPVVRQPCALELLRNLRWCDVFLQNNISLRTLWPLLLVRRPLFVAHQTWITNPEGGTGWPDRLKRFVLRYATSFAISGAVAETLPVPSIRVGNPYDNAVFADLAAEKRDRDLIFVGRLVSDKGADLLLDAMKLLEMKPRLTIAGDGPERATLEKRARDLQLQSQVTFVGQQCGEALANLLREHQILVVPSLWQEPFGIVALEGIACGCVVVGSAGGGLAEAIGPCGVTFPNGDAGALANAIAALLAEPGQRARMRHLAPSHLGRFTPRHVAGIYLDAMKKALP
ncbi:MAG TPA: glycosyltransferase family 4 protein [Chthoniobacterales bacterium]|nr:glycosyltransferase family 4 protein [Chthoniobacterales bacterium]